VTFSFFRNTTGKLFGENFTPSITVGEEEEDEEEEAALLVAGALLLVAGSLLLEATLEEEDDCPPQETSNKGRDKTKIERRFFIIDDTSSP